MDCFHSHYIHHHSIIIMQNDSFVFFQCFKALVPNASDHLVKKYIM